MKIVLLAVLCLVVESASASQGLYAFDKDPQHLWNRLHRAFFTRVMQDGKIHEYEDLEPPFYPNSKFLIEGPSNYWALAVLDEFIRKNGALAIKDPLKRAVMQRDLWAVFDMMSKPGLDRQAERRELQVRLTQIIKQLALTPEEVQSLPENYPAALESGVFAKDYNADDPDKPFLPADLFAPDTQWLMITNGTGGTSIAATAHADFTQNRSLFLIFMKLPGGKKETEKYIKKVRTDSENPPPIPVGTQFCVVRKMMLIDAKGVIQPTKVVELVEMRCYRPEEKMDVYKIHLHRTDFFEGKAGGLAPMPKDEKRYFGFGMGADDPAELPELPPTKRVLQTCIDCHSSKPTIYNVLSAFDNTSRDACLSATSRELQIRCCTEKKGVSYSWGLLQGLWEQDMVKLRAER